MSDREKSECEICMADDCESDSVWRYRTMTVSHMWGAILTISFHTCFNCSPPVCIYYQTKTRNAIIFTCNSNTNQNHLLRDMELPAKPRAFIAFHILLILLNHACLLHSRNLPTSPSPAPAGIAPARSLNPHEGRKANPRLGSFPATCQTKCNQCKPCVPVEVTIKTTAEEENQYYPIAWKCMCQSNIFSP
ncbi:EPIDERMAL PATTERNING FACTOR-like protein [Vigna angularis]|uniref:Epidermal patterning factor-like protein n=3 Tax=Phaseolus angularis TaxID=3914 RepID=A0A8T0JHI1_PHAAN|nr:uncharacterized protein LOC108319953 [Vigna angularis]KAG2375428.1 EPIDERMAL PATTERNING FACTOR-like protein [Vigna angularis]BAU00841.1 hypothetical protein VIGAN_10247600 [Vigna angularis var. angularis]